MKKVVILKIEEYDFDILKARIKSAIDKHFFADNLFASGDKVLLKPNLLLVAQPQDAITTHPVFIEAVGAIFKEMGCKVAIADSPGGFVASKDMDDVYESTRIKEIAARHNFELFYPNQSVVSEGFPLCWWVNGFKMVNLPKLKTHDIMTLTLATKNLYGCISGIHKSHLHKVYPKTADFTNIIIKLYKMIKPSLHIVDGILSLEGNGPAKKGIPRKLNAVVIADDALYCDYAISKLLGLKDDFNPLVKQAKKEGLLKEDLEIISEFEGQTIRDFKFPQSFILNSLPSPLISILKGLLDFRPVINKTKCTACAKCVEVCPQHAVTLDKGKAFIRYKQCIMCMCCSEMCKFGAVDLYESLLIKTIKALHKCIR
ncbi:MAG: DUF362 domain-containing protein [Candidatus Omnitrophota bacterium]